MPAFTPNRSYPYPVPADPADMPAALQALAEAVDDDIQALINTVSVVQNPLTVVKGSQQTIVTGTETPMFFTEITYDNTGTAVVPSSIVRISNGLYYVHFSARVPDTATKSEAFLRVGAGSSDFGRTIHEQNSLAQPRLIVSSLVNAVGTSFVQGAIIQNTGSQQPIYTARLMAYKVA